MRHALIAAALCGAACAGNGARVQPDRIEQASRGISFIEDDLEKALALAKAEGKPLFVDAWAPW